MNYHRYFGSAAKPVETCIVGTGDFGRSFLGQARRVPLIGSRVAVDVSPERAAQAWASAGADPREIALCATAAEAKAAWDSGKIIAAGDLACVVELPIDVVIEATGHPEAGARHASLTVEAGRHLALVSKEVDIVVGPGLSAMARAKGKVVTPIDGDQPSLLMGQVTWAETLGFTLVAAGKSSEYDFVYDEASGNVLSNGRTAAAPGLSEGWAMGSRAVSEVVAERSKLVSMLPQRTVPDLCELLIAANALDLTPDRPDLHAPILRISEVPTAFSAAADGGLLGGDRRIDVFNCLRRPDEISFAGGVFVVVRCEDAASWEILREKGHVLSRNGATAMLYLPRHVLGLEAATSVLEAGILGISSGAEEPQPRFDLAARADADLPAGTMLTASGHHHSIANVSGYAVAGAALGAGVPVPYYLAANRRLARPVAKGALIACDDVEIAEDSMLATLRRRQDAVFFGAGAR
jgi:predicted homoserine dehydrogenase-like protein